MKRAKPTIDPLLGARVPKELISRFDEIVERHNSLGTGIIWTRSDAIRRALILGAESIETEVTEMAAAR